MLSLGVNRCAPKLDYSGFLFRHPANHRFSKSKGRTLGTLVVVHIVSGHGTFRSERSGEMPVPANSLFFVFPGVNHSYRYDDETGWVEEWMELDPTNVLPLLAEAGITAESPLRTFASIPAVAEAIAAWRKGAEAESGGVVEKMRQALVSNVAEHVTVRDAARRAGKCESRMRALFKRATVLSPKKYQMRSRLVRAGKLLRETDLPVGVVAEQTGFESIFAFSRRFRKLLGVSPSEYRRRKQ